MKQAEQRKMHVLITGLNALVDAAELIQSGTNPELDDETILLFKKTVVDYLGTAPNRQMDGNGFLIKDSYIVVRHLRVLLDYYERQKSPNHLL